MDMACSTHGKMWNLFRNLVGKLEREIPLGRPTRRWEDNINMDLRETGWGGMDWMHVACDRGQCRGLTNTITILRVKKSIGNRKHMKTACFYSVKHFLPAHTILTHTAVASNLSLLAGYLSSLPVQYNTNYEAK
jgi:hypothetical protein